MLSIVVAIRVLSVLIVSEWSAISVSFGGWFGARTREDASRCAWSFEN
jgi:hypothetical protein